MTTIRQDSGLRTHSVKSKLYGLLLALLKAVSLSGITVIHALKKCRRATMEAFGRLKSKSNTRKENRS